MQKLRRILSCSAGLMVSAGIGHAETGSSEGRVGIIGITRGSADLRVPPSQPEDRTWRYGLGFALQIAPTEAGLFCNIRREYGPGVDFEIGTDVILFDDLSDIRAERAVIVSRNHQEPNPNSKPPGKPSIMVKYPVQPGFVPLGAIGEDGSPHPHAGTGFGVASALSWPAAVGDQIRGDVWWSTDPRGVKPFTGDENHSYFEVQQYQYDGNEFKVTETLKVAETDLLSGWQVRNRGLGPAIPDSEDLIWEWWRENHQRQAASMREGLKESRFLERFWSDGGVRMGAGLQSISHLSLASTALSSPVWCGTVMGPCFSV